MSGRADDRHWPANARRLIDRQAVNKALDEQAARLEERLRGGQRLTLMVLMNGGMYPAVALGSRIKMPLLFDHVHATRYRGATTGGDLKWVRWPDAVDGTILLVDDIFDEGYTMQAVRQRLLDEGAEQVITASLTVKMHDRGLPRSWVDDAAIEVPDSYVFGCGMDWHGYWRQLDEVWALEES